MSDPRRAEQDPDLALEWPDPAPQIVEPQPDFGFDEDFRDLGMGNEWHDPGGPMAADGARNEDDEATIAPEEAAMHVRSALPDTGSGP